MQLGVKSCELHGDVTQALRYLALQRFRDNEVDVMVSTSLTRFVALILTGAKTSHGNDDVQKEHCHDRTLPSISTNQVCTDVAARGLDIPGVQTVINAEMPRSASTYVPLLCFARHECNADA